MSRKKNLRTAASTFAVALGIGFIMQYGDAVASRFQPEQEAKAPVVITPEMVIPADVVAANSFAIPEVVSDMPADETIALAALNTSLSEVPAPVFEAPEALAAPDCSVEMTADALPMAMVALSVSAPCHP